MCDRLTEFKERVSTYFISVDHQIDFVSKALDELVICSDQTSNVNKIEPVISLILFTFYNPSCFEICLKNGLFNKLIKLFLNAQKLGNEVANLKQNKVPLNQKAKTRTALTIVHGFNFFFDLVKEQNKFNEFSNINKDDFESITLILQLIEQEMDTSTNVEVLLSFMLRVINLAYNTPDAEEILPEEFT